MKYQTALDLMKPRSGFRVYFERVEGKFLCGDYFPDRDEELINSESDAWELAKKFANENTKGKYVNIYVVDRNYVPVKNYKKFEIENR